MPLKLRVGAKEPLTLTLPDGRTITLVVQSIGRVKAVLQIDAPSDVRISRPKESLADPHAEDG
jgi:hypothetical protein